MEPIARTRDAARRLPAALSGAFNRKEGFPLDIFKINTVNDNACECIMMDIILFRCFECFMYSYESFCSFVTK